MSDIHYHAQYVCYCLLFCFKLDIHFFTWNLNIEQMCWKAWIHHTGAHVAMSKINCNAHRTDGVHYCFIKSIALTGYNMVSFIGKRTYTTHCDNGGKRSPQ